MGVCTDSDDLIDEAAKAVNEAKKKLEEAETLVRKAFDGDTWGYDDWKREFKSELRAKLRAALDATDDLHDRFP